MGNNQGDTRRQFLKNAGRALILGALGLLCFKLGKRVSGVSRGEECIQKGICRGCSIYVSCGLPQALSAKRAGMKQ